MPGDTPSQSNDSPNQRRTPARARNGRRGHPREAHRRDHVSLSRHRSGAHRIERVVRCEIEDPLPVGERELQVFAALLGSAIDRLLVD